MELLMILILALTFGLIQRGVAIRVWGIPVFSQGFSGDASVHFAIIRHLASGSRSRFIENYLISPEPMSYPTAFHQFARLFSTDTLRRKPWMPNLFLHVGGIIFLGVVLWLVSGESVFATAVGLSIYLLAPTQWIFAGQGIVYLGLSERFFARLTCSAAYLGLAAGCVFNEGWLLVVGTVFSTTAILASIFARQALFFCTPLLSVLLLDFRPLLLVILAVILALALGGRHMCDGLRHTILTWRLYRTHSKKSPHVLGAMVRLFNWDMKPDRSLWKNLAYNLWEKDPTRLFFWNPELVLVAGIILLTPSAAEMDLALVLLPPVIIYILTLTERFNHLGEAYRYIEYNLTFLIPLIVGLVFSGSIEHRTVLICYAGWVASLCGVRYYWHMCRNKNKESSKDELLIFISRMKIDGPAIIFPGTMRLGADLVARRADWKSFWWQPGIISEGIFDEFIEEYPFLKQNWQPLAAKYGVTHIICEKSALERISWAYDFSSRKKILEDERYVAYGVKAAG